MKRKNLSLLLALLLIMVLVFPTSVLADEDASQLASVRLWIDGGYVETDVDPVIENGRTLVPIRVISEELGYEVIWDEEHRGVGIMEIDEEAEIVHRYLMLFIDQTNVFDVNPEWFTALTHESDDRNIPEAELFNNTIMLELDVPAKIINDRTMVPVRFVAEEFGMNVDWDNDERTVIIGDRSEYEAGLAK